MIMSNYLTELDNGRCIFNDNIECDDGYCYTCPYYYEKNKNPKQLEMEEVLQKYGESKKEKKRRK